MAVVIRMKRLGRKNRPYYRICATDIRSPRDGRVIEELGTYDPLVPETDARAVLNTERLDYWLSVGARPSARVGVLLKKYGKDGTHLDAQQKALNNLAGRKAVAISMAQESARKAAAAEAKRREEAEAKKKAEAEAAEKAKAEAEATATEEASAEETPPATEGEGDAAAEKASE